jgi:hypothetical protein
VGFGDGEQPSRRQRVKHRAGVGVTVRGDLGDGHPASYRLPAFAGLGQPEQDPPGDRLLVRSQLPVGGLGEACHRGSHPAELAVGRKGQPAAVASFPQRQQPGGHQRQPAGLAGHVAGHGFRQSRLEFEAGCGGGLLDRLPELVGGHLSDEHRVGCQQVGDMRVGSRQRVVVGPHHYDASHVVADGCAYQPVRVLLLPGRGQRCEQLLELVHHQQRSGAGGQLGTRLGGCGQHRVPPLAAGQHARTDGGDQPGPHHGGLAAARRSDDRQHVRVHQPGDQLCDQTLAAEEVRGVIDIEERQPLVWAHHPGRLGGFVRRSRQPDALQVEDTVGDPVL